MVERTPMLSVIVSVYNTELYLRQCMDSLVSQTFADMELVVVDDGSTDSSPAIIAEYAGAHPGKIAVVRKANGGLADARNAGIAAARGEYVGFVDGDDYVSHVMFQRLCDCARESDSDIVVCRMMGFDPDSGEQYPYLEGHPEDFGVSLRENPALLVECSPSVCDKIFRATLFHGGELKFPVGLAFEDLATTYSLLARANRIDKVEEYLYFYRRSRTGSIMSSYGGHYEQLIDTLEIMYARFASDGLFETFREPIERVALEQLILGRYADFFLHAPMSIKFAYVDRVFAHLDRHFPGWKRGPVLASMCTSWWLRTVSTHRLVLKLYTALPSRVALSLGWRLRMFASGRA